MYALDILYALSCVALDSLVHRCSLHIFRVYLSYVDVVMDVALPQLLSLYGAGACQARSAAFSSSPLLQKQGWKRAPAFWSR